MTAVDVELKRFGQLNTRWRAELWLLRGGACVLGAVVALGFLDLAFGLGRGSRWLGFAGLLLLTAFVAVRIVRAANRRYSPEGLAAMLERLYPELDNHLINYLQFSRNPDASDLRADYVAKGAPTLAKLDVQRMKNRRAHRQGAAACSLAATLLVLPFFVVGSSWAHAIWRGINPLSPLAPVTLTRILSVAPGTAYVAQGESSVLVCRVEGMPGHTVRVDVSPVDGRPVTYELGRIGGADAESFSHRVPRVNARLRYRFRAGDAPAGDWHTLTPRPPPALRKLVAIIEPPAYTALQSFTLDLRSEEAPLPIPAGSRVTVRAASVAPLETLSVAIDGAARLPMRFDAGNSEWEAELAVTAPGVLRFEGEDSYAQRLNETVSYGFKPDRPPVIEIVEPTGRIVLPPGAAPQIVFRVVDDYGLGSVHIEQVTRSEADGAEGAPLERWTPGGTAFEHLWLGQASSRQTALAYRIVAADTMPETPRVARSAPIVFDRPPAERTFELRDKLEAQGAAALQQIIDLQQTAIERTAALRAVAEGEAPWKEPAERQREVRRLTRVLLDNPVRPLGGRTQSIGALYANEMALAIDAIERIGAGTDTGQRGPRIDESLAIQASILRQLKGAEAAVDKARIERRQSGIDAMLSAIIEGQSDLLKRLAAGAGDVERLVDRQDELSEDVSVFESACEREAKDIRGNDAVFAERLEAVAEQARERNIREDMLKAADRIENLVSAEASALGERALANLKALQEMLGQVELSRRQSEQEAMVEALAVAQDKLERVAELHKAMQESIDTIRGHVDKDTEAFDVFAEEFVELLRKNKETLLTIPVDLHVFTDLNVGNELVEDVFSVFQEVEQVAGSEKVAAEDIIEMAFAKNLEMLELMREMKDRMDDVEMWLVDRPETHRVLTETLDREEMPEAGVALGALASQLEDLIGDLKEQDQDNRDAADDGATTHALPDAEMGWDVYEGDLSSFAAKGKSGNITPDHKEQDGRGNVGRQGMASGETAAGSGTIGEGDKDIKARRTEDPIQSGMVQLEGEADTVATGGGKLGSGKADDFGMEGGGKRMDSTEVGSWEGMAALMANQAESVAAEASLKNVRVDSLQAAVHHLRQVDDAIARGNIRQMEEHGQMAVASLKRASMELSRPAAQGLRMDAPASVIENAVQAGPDLAPPGFQDQVAEYYKMLNDAF